MKWQEDELEKFIRDNKEQFDIYQPQPNHNEHFLVKLYNKFKEIISIIPYLIKVGIVTIILFVVSFLVWNSYLRPPLSKVSLKKYWKIEHVYQYEIHKDTRILLKDYIKDSIEIRQFKSEMEYLHNTYKSLKEKLKTNPSNENITNMLQYYKAKLYILEEKIKYYEIKSGQK
jgi:hypothetical protein